MNTKPTLAKPVKAALAMLALLAPTAAQEDFFISGYGNAHWMDHQGLPVLTGTDDLNNGFFQLREFSLFFDFPITETLGAAVEIEMADNATLFTANYAYLDVQATDNLTLRVGKYLIPFLDYNENKPNYRQSLMSQPFTAWVTVPVNGTPIQVNGFGWSDVGAMASLTHEAGDAGLLNLKVGLLNGLQSPDPNALDANDVTLSSGPTIRPRDGLVQNESGLADNNSNKAIVAKLAYQDFNTPLNVGVSFYQGKWDEASTKNLTMFGLHANWEAERYSFKSEYSLNDVEQTAGVLVPGAPALNTTTGDYGMNAFYLQGTVTPWIWDDERWIKFILRYDAVDSNDEAAFTPFRRDRWTAGFEWQFSDGARFRGEVQRSTIDDFDNAPAPFVAAGGEEEIDMAMFSIIFWF